MRASGNADKDAHQHHASRVYEKLFQCPRAKRKRATAVLYCAWSRESARERRNPAEWRVILTVPQRAPAIVSRGKQMRIGLVSGDRLFRTGCQGSCTRRKKRRKTRENKKEINDGCTLTGNTGDETQRSEHAESAQRLHVKSVLHHCR